MWLGPFPSSHFWCLLLSASPLLCLHTHPFTASVWGQFVGSSWAQVSISLTGTWPWTVHWLPVFLCPFFKMVISLLTKMCILSSFIFELAVCALFFSSFPVLFAPAVCWLKYENMLFSFSYPASRSLIISAADQSEQVTTQFGFF